MPELNPNCRQWLDDWDPELATLVADAEMPSLGHGPGNPSILQWLDRSADPLDRHARGPLVASGLLLLAGELDRSHSISQQDPSAEGSFLHGIMHRREADFSNAKYWFRKVGDHQVVDTLGRECPGYGDPFRFVDACEHDPDSAALCEVAWQEWQTLMNWIATR